MLAIFLYVFAFFIPFIFFIGLGIIINNHCGPRRKIFFRMYDRLLMEPDQGSLFQPIEYTYFWQLHPFLLFIYVVFAISASITFYFGIYGGIS